MGSEKDVDEKQYDLKQLDEIAAGNRDFLIALAKIYIDTTPLNSKELVEATRAGDWNKVSKLAHKLKSTIDSMNMIAIKNDIRSLEIDAKNKVNTALLTKMAEKVDKVINTVAAQLAAEFSL